MGVTLSRRLTHDIVVALHVGADALEREQRAQDQTQSEPPTER